MTKWPRAQRVMGRLHARLYRCTRGRIGGRWFAGAPVMVLETVGRRSGQRRDTGHGAVWIGATRRTVRPRELAGDERVRAWHAFVEMFPQAEYYARFTDRPFPLVAFEPAPTTPASEA
ncbi:nitroreductase/quinone reductase family protein [Mycolicibacterium phlei]